MSRKVFVSFLGTNNYLQARYQIGETICTPTRFVQEAILETLRQKGVVFDCVFIFYTDESCKKNWCDNGQERVLENKEIESRGLGGVLKSKYNNVEGVSIKEGFSEEDVWSIFNTVYDKLEDGDEIYFDVTHAFRSIPMFSTVLFGFSQYMKDTTLQEVYYGAFERLGPAYEVKNMPVEKRIAPVLRLSNMIRLQQYTEMSNSLVSFGRMKEVAEGIANDDVGALAKSLAKNLNKLDEYININDINNIKNGGVVAQIKGCLKKMLKSKDLPMASVCVLERLKSELSGFIPEDSYQNVEAAIMWAKKYKMILPCYTMGQEYLITRLCDICSSSNPFDGKDADKSFRSLVSAVCAMKQEDVDAKNYRGIVSVDTEKSEELLSKDVIRKIREPYRYLTDNRNNLNHGKGNKSFDTFVKSFEKYYSECLEIVNEV